MCFADHDLWTQQADPFWTENKSYQRDDSASGATVTVILRQAERLCKLINRYRMNGNGVI
jgi:hypothetical protein